MGRPNSFYPRQTMSDKPAEIRYDRHLDAKGLNCPLPVLKAKLALNGMHPGEVLYVEATDPHATIDFEAYCARSGHTIVETTHAGDIIGFFISRAENPVKI